MTRIQPNGLILTLSLLVWVLTGFQNAGFPSTSQPRTRPNILIVTADDLAYNSVGAFGCSVKNITVIRPSNVLPPQAR